MLLKKHELMSEFPDLFTKLNSFINKNNTFPCLFGISSFNKNYMYFSISHHNNFSNTCSEIANDMINYSKILSYLDNGKEKSYTTILAVMPNLGEINLRYFMPSLFKELNKNDNNCSHIIKEEEIWLDNFEFEFNSEKWVPILLDKSHITEIRQSPFTMVAFQPQKTFEYNKSECPIQYDRIRNAIWKRIKNIYPKELPYYLGKSKGNLIIQSTGFDFNNTLLK